MEIGTIGAGAFAQAFAKRALKAGHKVKLSNSVIDLGNLRDGGLIQQAGGPLAGRDLLERGD